MGVAAHALDELHGRPLGTRIPDAVLWALAAVGLAGAVALGVDGHARGLAVDLGVHRRRACSWCVAYNLELFGGVVHSDLWFALAWGAFPALTASFAQTARLGPRRSSWRPRARRSRRRNGCCPRRSAGCAGASRRSRERSRCTTATSRRSMRRRLRSAPERALRWMSLAMPLLALGLLLARLPS